MVVLCEEQGQGQPVSSPGGWLLGLCEVRAEALWHLAQAPSSAFGKKNIFKNTSIFIFCRQLDCASLM